MSKAWHQETAADLGRGIGEGRICPVELTEHFLARSAGEGLNGGPVLAGRIYARLMETQARAEAEAARDRARKGTRRGVLDGVPVAWKDLFDTAGVATEAGSALLAGRVPTEDAVVVERLNHAGLPPLGKTHMTELAFSGLGLNPITAHPPCVNDPEAAPGGSSSGSAAAVAFGAAPLAIGSDTGGSVRLPAAWNDLVGLKTSPGRIPAKGTVPLAARFDTIGPLAKSVEDAALAFALLDGSAAPDLAGASLKGKRLLVLETIALDDLQDPVARGFEAALFRLAAAGAEIKHGKVAPVAEAMAISGILYTAECYGTWAKVIEAAPEKMYPPVLERFRAGAEHRACDYVAAWLRLDELREEWAQLVAEYDAVILPTNAILPPKVAPLLADAAAFARTNLATLRNTRIGNLSGGCGLTLPSGTASVGVSFMAPAGGEAALLRLGAAAEKALAG
ncbi:amidase [Pararhodobacter sp.]|uniref:amidase n=1 Tax=Pararhodobacter sp. TaxID=2127056 RepID=UPI002FE33145